MPATAKVPTTPSAEGKRDAKNVENQRGRSVVRRCVHTADTVTKPATPTTSINAMIPTHHQLSQATLLLGVTTHWWLNLVTACATKVPNVTPYTKLKAIHLGQLITKDEAPRTIASDR
ncbi:hypothetical protein CAQU_10140 [Corynebacterium aquilae DSM 44791]|uniref:Uncharacterized protein n=1 Tax=Corynebacterium aquilae DSM 44791 TaxID=1431546 RepID=A0A1L7CHR5_9CORY|nr:hypothetical protein CAQU_10140 [Corynebacterium aquilae DSM 44791]